MINDTIIEVKNVYKTFKLPHERSSSLKGLVVNFWRRDKGYELQKALQDISFEVKKGEFLGIVGRNGSGKSTLLKLIAGIYSPDSGSIQVSGKLTPFIELGVGFSPELTGRENVFLNGSLFGFNRKEMAVMYDDIVEFAELERFMDQKLKNYSSGMQVRLAFSIAIRVQSDILVLDEVLAVGDEAFQRKCNDYFSNLKKTKQTVILVTHDMNSVRKYCNKAILIEDSNIILTGSPEDVANQYTLSNFESRKSVVKKSNHPIGLSDLVPNIEITPVSKQVLTSKDTFEFEMRYTVTKDIPVRFGISLIDENSGGATSIFDDQIRNERGKLIPTSEKRGEYSYKYKIPLNRFNNRNFIITATLYKITKSSVENIAYTAEDRMGRFAIRGEKRDGGLLKEKGQWVS